MVRGRHGLVGGQKIDVARSSADSARGFIDVEYPEGVEPRKEERSRREREAAIALGRGVGYIDFARA